MADDQSAEHEDGDDSTLVLAAAGGDRRAAGEYFARHLPRLSSIARRVAGTSHDPGDLLGDALVVVLSKWADGTGPTEHINAYIAQTMRNRMKDDFKSPRSKVRHFDEDEDPAASDDPRLRRIELEGELALIRRAMAELPDDQQLVLTATIVDGIRPKDLQERLDRPMSAIYSLTHRARANLRRATLRLMLEEDARPECHAAAQHLPDTIENSPDNIRGSRFTEHYRTCRRCRRLWMKFGAMATLGFAPLLVIGDLLLGTPVAAQASSEDSPPDQSPNPQPQTVPGSGPAIPQGARGDHADSVSSAQRAASAIGAARPLMRIAVTAAITASAAGAAILTFLAVAFLTQTFWFTPEPTASLDVVVQKPSASLVTFDFDFEVYDESWTIRTARLVMSQPVEVTESPDGWVCEASDRIVVCTTGQVDADGGSITLSHSASDPRLDFALVVEAVTENGAVVEANYADTLGR